MKGRTPTSARLTGKLHGDPLNWSEYVQVDGQYVRYWIWGELDRLRRTHEGKKVTISIEVLDESG